MTLEEKFADRYDDGRIEGKAEGIRGTIDILKESGFSDDEILEKIKSRFGLTEKEAQKYFS